MEWRADTVQAVAFIAPGKPQPDSLALWAALFSGTSPETFQRPSGAPNAASTAGGASGDHQVIVQSQIGRIDLVRHPLPPTNNDGPPHLPDFATALRLSGADLIKLGSVVQPFRVAIVASMSVPAPDGFSALLAEVTQGAPFPAGATDCLFQYNIRKPSTAASGVQINRLCQWASGEQQLISLNIDGMNGNGQGAPVAIQTHAIVNLKIDINSATNLGYDFGDAYQAHVEEILAEVEAIAAGGVEALR